MFNAKHGDTWLECYVWAKDLKEADIKLKERGFTSWQLLGKDKYKKSIV